MNPFTIAHSPEEAGLSSRALLNLLDAAEASGIQLHSLMVVKDGMLAADLHFAPHTQTSPHICHSMSKPFTSFAAGFAVSEGLLKLSDHVVDVLADQAPEHPDPWLSQVTLAHLLSMSSGLVQKSDNLEHIFSPGISGEDWAKATLAWGCDAQPGTVFRYNSHGSYLISCMVQRAAGVNIRDYLTPRLFEPLGIEPPRWEMSPQGICCGGWGLYLSCLDFAKVGCCLLDGGKYGGAQILPKMWLPLATQKHIVTDNVPRHREWAQGYGYHLWRCTNGRFRGDGTGGQFLIIDPAQNMLVAATADTENLTGEHDLFDQYLFGSAHHAPACEADQRAYAERIRTLHVTKE